MARRKGKREEEVQCGSIIAMIDVVFQLIIFFVCTSSMQERPDTDRITLPVSPHGAPVKAKDPLEFRININAKGVVDLTGFKSGSEDFISAMIAKTMAHPGVGANLVVTIRADVKTKHRAVKKVMDAATKAGIARIKFIAIQKAKPATTK
ncbi:MAG: biopolymer transporter ExbD [bacterium]